jgi:fumarate reductase flavoprotein subunit
MKAVPNATTSTSSNTLAFRDADGTTRLEYSDVKITTLPPAKRVYGAEAEAAEKKETTHG